METTTISISPTDLQYLPHLCSFVTLYFNPHLIFTIFFFLLLSWHWDQMLPQMHVVSVRGQESLNYQIKLVRPSQEEGSGAEPVEEAGWQYRWKSPIFCH